MKIYVFERAENRDKDRFDRSLNLMINEIVTSYFCFFQYCAYIVCVLHVRHMQIKLQENQEHKYSKKLMYTKNVNSLHMKIILQKRFYISNV